VSERPEDLARRAEEAAAAEDMAGGQPPSDAERALAEGGAATGADDVAEAVAAEDVEPPAAQGEPGIPPVLADATPQGADAASDEAPTVEHPLPAATGESSPPPQFSAAGGPTVAAGTTPPEADRTNPKAEAPWPRAALPPDTGGDIHVHAPGFAVADTPVHGSTPLADAEQFIERAIESVLEQVPDVADEEPEGSAKLQPWAETAAPPSKNKRPLSELLDQYAARVAAEPDAVAGRPRGQHPVAAFFARFTPQGGGRAAEGPASGGGRGRRRRGRRGAPQGAAPTPQPQGAPQQGRQPRGPRPQQGEPRPQRPAAQPQGAADGKRGPRRRRRRGGRGGGGGGAPAQG